MLIQYCNQCGKRLPANEAAVPDQPALDPASLRCDECRAAEAAKSPKRVSHASLKPAMASSGGSERSMKMPLSAAPTASGSLGRKLSHGQGRSASSVATAGTVAVVVSVLIVLAYLGFQPSDKPQAVSARPPSEGAAKPTETRKPNSVTSAAGQPTRVARTSPETAPSRKDGLGTSLPVAPEPARPAESDAALKAADAFAQAKPEQNDRIAEGYRKVTEQFPGTPAAYAAEMRMLRAKSRDAPSASSNTPAKTEEPAITAVELPDEFTPGLWKTIWDCSPDTKIAFHRFRSSGPQATVSYTDQGSVYVKHHGVLVVAKAGTYGFEIDCDGWGRLDIDGKEVTSSWSHHVGRKDLNLSAGAHEILVIRCGNMIGVKWKLVGGFDMQAIPEAALRYDLRKTDQYDQDNK